MVSFNTQISPLVKAWIEIERKVQFLFVSAKLQNCSNKVLNLSYILETKKKGGGNNSQTIQKGKCVSPNLKIMSLSESGMNLKPKENLTVSLLVFHDDRVIARDCVVFQGDNP